MALRFYKLQVKEVIRETADAISIVFDVPSELKETFSYKPGQYLTVQIFIYGQKMRRAYSLSSSPFTDEVLKITAKRVEQGKVSNYLNDYAKPGFEIEVMPPMGNFVPKLDSQNARQFIFFSGGSGITPIISIMKSVLRVEPLSKVLLFYGNRNAESIIFHRELSELNNLYSGRIETVHSLDTYSDDWEGYKGMIDKAKALYLLKTYASSSYAHAEYFLCGPAGMMREVEMALQEKIIDPKHIHKENFTSNLKLDTDEEKAVVALTASGALNFPVKAKIILDGNEAEIEVQEDETVLEAVIDADMDPPFACQIGACTTCRAKLQEGRVVMDEREALTDEEMDEGYILTCQSHPMTNYIIVDYDG